MSNNTETRQKYLINCQEGVNNIERATISFILAVSASKTNETAMFITSDAVALCTAGAVDGLVAPGYEPIANLMQDFITNGGKIWICPACIKAKNISPEDLMTGAEVAGAPRTMAFLESGAQILA
jgi:predicted peroxiredoxin